MFDQKIAGKIRYLRRDASVDYPLYICYYIIWITVPKLCIKKDKILQYLRQVKMDIPLFLFQHF